MRGSRGEAGGGRVSDIPLIKITKYRGFSNTGPMGPDPLKNRKLPSEFKVGPSSARQRNAI